MRIPIPFARLHGHGRDSGYVGADKVFCSECEAYFSPVIPEEPEVIRCQRDTEDE